MDHDTSIKLGDGGRSEERRPKIQEVGVGQRRRGLCCQFKLKQSTRESFLVVYLMTC
jgi:hypothetical protein